MAGTVATTEVTHSSVKKITFDWLSSTGGAADATTVFYFDGEFLAVTFEPDAGGTAPSDTYSVTLADADGRDLLLGQGGSLDLAVNEAVVEKMLPVAKSQLTLGVTDAGSANGGVVTVWLR
jgi:hypothetical protein